MTHVLLQKTNFEASNPVTVNALTDCAPANHGTSQG